MNTDNLLNARINHRIFGEGVIDRIDGNHLEVCFEKKNKRCTFSYPSCFRDFLSVYDNNLKVTIDEDLSKWYIESGTFESEKLKKKTEKTQKGIQERERERKRKRVERAKSDADRARFFAGSVKKTNED